VNAQCVIWLAELKSVSLLVCRERSVNLNGDSPSDKTKPSRSGATGFEIPIVFCQHSTLADRELQKQMLNTYFYLYLARRSPGKKCSPELQTSKTTLHTVLHAYKSVAPSDCYGRQCAVLDCALDRLAEDADYLRAVLFTDEAIFHTSGVVNRHKCRIWGTENRRETA
jgi:hypothetical protein